MSLSREQFDAASDAADELGRRLVRLFGFSHPAITDHYCCTHLYNKSISVEMTDEEILEIHEKFLRWKEKILAVFAEYGADMDAKRMKSLFRSDRMCGTMYFLDIPVDIDAGTDLYRPAILTFLEKKKP